MRSLRACLSFGRLANWRMTLSSRVKAVLPAVLSLKTWPPMA